MYIPRVTLEGPQVDVRVKCFVLRNSAAADFEYHRLPRRAILKMMPVAHAGRETRAVAGPQHFFTAIGREHDLS